MKKQNQNPSYCENCQGKTFSINNRGWCSCLQDDGDAEYIHLAKKYPSTRDKRYINFMKSYQKKVNARIKESNRKYEDA